MRSFFEVILEDAFQLDPETGVLSFQFGAYELTIEPTTRPYHFFISLYWERMLVLPDKLYIQPGYVFPVGPGEESKQRRQLLRACLADLLEQLDEAEKTE